MKRIDMKSKRFGKFTVLAIASKNKSGDLTWLCKCDCGNEKVIVGTCLRNGSSKSCGCLCKEKNRKIQTKHGKRKTRIYGIWAGMKQRCLNPSNQKYKNYGGRGIEICNRWMNFENFYKDMGDPPIDYSIDRIDNDGNYEPSNCKWSTNIEQSNNTTTNRVIEFYGLKLTIAQWSRMINISARTLRARLFEHNWSIQKALTTPVGGLA